MVITPYNLQVNYLTSILPAGARVGTVDKLQGQQAEVVLISMVTSSGDDLPRDIEFLYSKNRLNVAVSRARSLACIVASPRLLADSVQHGRAVAVGEYPLLGATVCGVYSGIVSMNRLDVRAKLASRRCWMSEGKRAFCSFFCVSRQQQTMNGECGH